MPSATHWLIGSELRPLQPRSLLMGILNVTPDSFSDGGKFIRVHRALDHALTMIQSGADIIDIGGESTRPGADPVTAEEEIRRVIPVIERLRSETSALISIDTFKAEVARQAVAAGADIINDITGLRGDPAMMQVAADCDAGIIVMHMQGMPRTMQQAPHYDDVVAEVSAFFEERIATLVKAGVDPARIALDPGIGFGKLLPHNLALLRAIPRFCEMGHTILIGASRKSFLGQLLDSKAMADRHWPTVAITSYTRELGATVHRVHDISACAQALRMTEAILAGYTPPPQP
jgi:dihydropteroate synthase